MITDNYGRQIKIGDYALIRLFSSGFNIHQCKFKRTAMIGKKSANIFSYYARVMKVESQKDLKHIKKIMSKDMYL